MAGLHEPGTDFSAFTVSKELVPITPVETPVSATETKVDTPTNTEPAKAEVEVKTETKTESAGKEPLNTEPAKIEDADLFKILHERGGISAASFEELKATYSERENLKKQVEELANKKLEFPNEKAKALYEFAVKHTGTELGAAKNYLNLVELDLTKADAKTKMFEAFALENPSLPRERAKVIFDAKYEKDYGDGNFEGNPLLEYEHEKQAKTAEQAIAQAVKAYNEAKVQDDPGPTQAEIESEKRILAGIEQSLKDYKEASITLGEYQTKIGEKIPQGSLKVAMTPEEVATVSDYMRNPDKILNEVLLKDNGGTLNYQAYRDAITTLLYPEKIYAQVHAQGIEQGLLAAINQAKNNQREKTPDNGKEAERPKSWADSIDDSRAKN